MGRGESLIFYLVLGAAVAVAVFVSGRGSKGAGSLFRVLTAFCFWPLYLPLLLARDRPAPPGPTSTAEAHEVDDLSAAIARVDQELAAALSSLDGWAGDVLERDRDRIEELKRAWKAQAARIREMDALLGTEESVSLPPTGEGVSERLVKSAAARRQNFDRLREVRRRARDDLLGTLTWVRELVSMIHLAKFTGAPAARAEELVAQIAASVEGLSEVAEWQ